MKRNKNKPLPNREQLNELSKQIRAKADNCGFRTKTDRARRGAYIDAVLMLEDLYEDDDIIAERLLDEPIGHDKPIRTPEEEKTWIEELAAHRQKVWENLTEEEKRDMNAYGAKLAEEDLKWLEQKRIEDAKKENGKG